MLLPHSSKIHFTTDRWMWFQRKWSYKLMMVICKVKLNYIKRFNVSFTCYIWILERCLNYNSFIILFYFLKKSFKCLEEFMLAIHKNRNVSCFSLLMFEHFVNKLTVIKNSLTFSIFVQFSLLKNSSRIFASYVYKNVWIVFTHYIQ